MYLGAEYSSPAQKVRKVSEAWTAANAYCLSCESDKLVATGANTKARDFLCERCGHPYELKSKRGPFSRKVLDGAYGTMIKTIREQRTPTFLLLEYSEFWAIRGLTAIHHSLITEPSIEARKPLALSARRAGWVGCNIVLPAIALDAKIPIIRNGVMEPKDKARKAFARLENLATLSSSERGWAGAVLNVLRRLPNRTFTLTDVYSFEGELQRLYPQNQHVRAKIRQQLQVLRDAGLLVFSRRGHYQFLTSI